MKRLYRFALFLLILSCQSTLQLSDTRNGGVKINSDSLQLSDNGIHELIAPYKRGLDSLMSEVLCENSEDLKKELPEGTLNNFLCDALMEYAMQNVQQRPDFCIYNYGGIRIQTLSKGPVKVGKIFELAPFENTLVVVKLKGTYCLDLLHMAAQNGGTPVSSELRMAIQNNQAYHPQVKRVPIDTTRYYYILTNDYVAAGGDKTEAMKKAETVIDTGIKVRDALIALLREKGNKGMCIKSGKDGRMVNN